MARTKTETGVLRDAVNGIAENVKILGTPVMLRKPEIAVEFLAELREQVSAAQSVLDGITSAYNFEQSLAEYDAALAELDAAADSTDSVSS